MRYIYSHRAPELIHEFEPNAYIVALLRNPVDMMYSLHGQLLSHGVESIADFEQALVAEQDRPEQEGGASGIDIPVRAYRARARYGEQLPRWVETFGIERVHVIIFEELVRDPASTFCDLLQFLEVDDAYRPDSFAAHNRGHAPRSQLLRTLATSRVPQHVSRKVSLRVAGERGARSLVRKVRHSRLYRRDVPRPPLRPEFRRQLEAEFYDDVAALSKLLGRDPSALWWKTGADGEGRSEDQYVVASTAIS